MNFLKTTALSLALTMLALGAQSAPEEVDVDNFNQRITMVQQAPLLKKVQVFKEQFNRDSIKLFGNRAEFQVAASKANFASIVWEKLGYENGESLDLPPAPAPTPAPKGKASKGKASKGKAKAPAAAAEAVPDTDAFNYLIGDVISGRIADDEIGATLNANKPLIEKIITAAQRAEQIEKELNGASQAAENADRLAAEAQANFQRVNAQLERENQAREDLETQLNLAQLNLANLQEQLTQQQALATASADDSQNAKLLLAAQQVAAERVRELQVAEAHVEELQGQLREVTDQIAIAGQARLQALEELEASKQAHEETRAMHEGFLASLAEQLFFEEDNGKLPSSQEAIQARLKEFYKAILLELKPVLPDEVIKKINLAHAIRLLKISHGQLTKINRQWTDLVEGAHQAIVEDGLGEKLEVQTKAAAATDADDTEADTADTAAPAQPQERSFQDDLQALVDQKQQLDADNKKLNADNETLFATTSLLHKMVGQALDDSSWEKIGELKIPERMDSLTRLAGFLVKRFAQSNQDTGRIRQIQHVLAPRRNPTEVDVVSELTQARNALAHLSGQPAGQEVISMVNALTAPVSRDKDTKDAWAQLQNALALASGDAQAIADANAAFVAAIGHLYNDGPTDSTATDSTA